MLRRLNTALRYGHAERLQAVGEATVRFVTASVVALRPTDTGFTAVVASGGHPPPVLVRSGGGVEQLVVDGPLLGVFDDHCYEERTTELGLSDVLRSEEHTSELQSLMRISYAVFCLKKKKTNNLSSKTNT